jgi:hypothetical protein
MKLIIKSLIATATIAAAAIAAPALADGPHGYGHGYGYGHGRPVVAPVYVTQHPMAGLREINMRQAEQRSRIEHGFHRGAITRWEFRRLMAEQHDIEAMERAFVSDGFLSPHERAELHRRLDMASRHIFAQAHDHERRF